MQSQFSIETALFFTSYVYSKKTFILPPTKMNERMKKNIFYLLLIISCSYLSSKVTAQVLLKDTTKISILNGYVKEIEGENLPYRSSYPEFAKVSLLTRTTDGKKIISWQTEAVPKDVTGNYFYFHWLAGHSSGTSKSNPFFDLLINDEYILTFNPPRETRLNNVWKFSGKNGTEVYFEATKQDAVDDVFGNMYLKIPVGLYKKGEPLKISVKGQLNNQPDWFMTFKYSYSTKIEIEPLAAIVKENNQLQRIINIKVDHISAPTKMFVSLNGKKKEFLLAKGYNDFDFPFPNHNKKIFASIIAEIPQILKKEVKLQLHPVALRKIGWISHSHSDIGYSHLQEEVEQLQNKNIDDALKLIEKTKDYEAEAKYKWNIESLWVLKNYLREASTSKKEKLFEAIKEGSIGLSAFYSHNMTGLMRAEENKWLLEYATVIEKEIGIKITSAMITDIPGSNWSLITDMAQNGIKYFSSGPNYFLGTKYSGDRVGHSNNAWADKPFYWKSSSGKEKVLYWMAGKGYSYFHSFGQGDLDRRGKEHILNYMKELDSKNYPYNLVQLRYTIKSDNGPTDSTLSGFVQNWNKKYFSPKIVLTTTEDLFKEFESNYGKDLPEFSGDFTPYWEDGAMSSAKEELMNREASLKFVQGAAISSIINSASFNLEMAASIKRNITLFHEHTWGAHNSISDPDNDFVTKQWNYKQKFALNALRDADIVFNNVLKGISDSTSNRIEVFSSASWSRSSLVFLDYTNSKRGNQIYDENNNQVPTQALNDGRLVFWAENIPPLGSKKYWIGSIDLQNKANNILTKDITVSIDKWLGQITSIKYKGLEIIDKKSKFGFNSYVYVPGENPNKFEKETNSKFIWVEEGELISKFIIESKGEGSSKIIKEITVNNPENSISIVNKIYKNPVRNKEAVHFSFPFAVSNPTVKFDVGYAAVDPLKNQLTGSNRDYYSVDKWIDVSNNNFGITLSALKAPLFEIGEMIDEQKVNGDKIWRMDYKPSSTIFSYTMNNYWHTNFKAYQEGETIFEYKIKPHKIFDNYEAYKFSFEYHNPLIAQGVQKDFKSINSLFTISFKEVIVRSIEPLVDNSFIVTLFNTSTNRETSNIIWGSINASKVYLQTAEGEKEIGLNHRFEFLPNEVIRIIIKTNRSE